MARCAVVMENVREVALGRAMVGVSVTKNIVVTSVTSAVRDIIRASKMTASFSAQLVINHALVTVLVVGPRPAPFVLKDMS